MVHPKYLFVYEEDGEYKTYLPDAPDLDEAKREFATICRELAISSQGGKIYGGRKAARVLEWFEDQDEPIRSLDDLEIYLL